MTRTPFSQYASIAILAISTAGAIAYLIWALPLWVAPSVLIVLNSVALALVTLKRSLGYALGQLGLFLFMLVAIMFIVVDPEEQLPLPHFTAISQNVALVLTCVLFLGCAIALRSARARVQLRPHTPVA